MKNYILFAIILLLPLLSFSQINKDGIPFISSYTDEDYGEAGQIWSITQDTRGVMYFGCNYGLKTYDGRNWRSYNIPNTTIVRSMVAYEDGVVFYGAESDFGAILSDDKGDLEFYSFYLNKFEGAETDFGSIWKTLIANDKVYFQAFEKVFYCDLPLKFDQNDSLINEIKTVKPETLFHLSFSVNDKIYIREWEKGLHILDGDKKELIPGGEQFAFLRLYIMLPLDDNKILLGTRQNGFYIYDRSKKTNAITPFQLEENDLIMNSTLYAAVNLPNGNIAIGTFSQGIIVINREGQTVQHIDASMGLPDNYVLSIYSNEKRKDHMVWFGSDRGIFKSEITAPFTVWDNKMGISGSPAAALKFNDILYISTSEGLFYLDETERRPIFKLIAREEVWTLMIYHVPDSDEKKLIMAYATGISEIKNFESVKIADAQNAVALYQSEKNPEYIYIGSDVGLSAVKFENNKWSDLEIYDKNPTTKVVSIKEYNDYIALGTGSSGVRLIKDFNDENIIVIDSLKGLPLYGQDFFLYKIQDNMVVASGEGLYALADTGNVEPFILFGEMYANHTKGAYKFMEDEDAYWLSVYGTKFDDANHELLRFKDKKSLEKDSVFSKRIPAASTRFIYPDKNFVWIGNSKGIYKFNKDVIKDYTTQYNTIISRVLTKNDSILYSGNLITGYEKIQDENADIETDQIPILKYNNNELLFIWGAPFYEKEEVTEYCYRLIGETEEWSKWNNKNERRYTNLYEGDYTFEVKARNIYNTESSIASYTFTILPPWYRTIWAYFLYLVLAVFLVFIIIKLYTKKLKRENEKLEQTVKERTAEIRMQNEEIKAQRDEIQAQKDQVEKAKDKIEKQQKSIMDSIHYASRIQEAVLPPDEYLQEILGEHFVLFKPRDIVSGDFYWATQRGNKTVIVAADCTGHGVPGAFMSMLGISFLNEIVNKEEILQANIILNRLRQNVKRSLRQTGKENEAKDGMDIAICIIDMDEMKIQFAGAYNPLYLLRDGEISRVKADRMPIGIYLREKESFANNIVEIQKGDYLYIFSDGYVDQFGGPTDDKIKSAKFKSLLLDNHQKSPEEQKEALVQYLDEWMAYKDKTGRTYKQVDDILVIGIEI